MSSEDDENDVHEFDPYPMDYAKLQRGGVVHVHEIKQMFGIDPLKGDTADDILRRADVLRTKTLRLSESIRNHFLKDRGIVVSTRIIQGSIVILDPPNQHENSKRKLALASRKVFRAYRDLMHNDPRGLTDDMRKEQIEMSRIWGWKVQQLKKPAPPELTNRDDDE